MSLTNTPRANQLHIGIYGKRNSGKSSLINALTNQKIAIVSDVPGTTADPVYKTMELHGLGPCVFVDTAGFDDEGELGNMRVEKTKEAMEKTDLAILVCTDEEVSMELMWFQMLQKKKIPCVIVLNKIDVLEDAQGISKALQEQFHQTPISVSAREQHGIEKLREALIRLTPQDYECDSIVGDLVEAGDSVLLVMPQDIQAPKGRLILPQVQTMRDLLDKNAILTCCTTDQFLQTLQALKAAPKLIITDSQAFAKVYQLKPKESMLTSFSILFARYKGDIQTFVEGANAVERLTKDSKVLIAEACTHAPLTEDIGRVKIPRLLRKRFGDEMQIQIVSGTDFPSDLGAYDLIIHCGACMFNRKYVLSRIEKAKQQGVPITNYGVVMAYFADILDKVSY